MAWQTYVDERLMCNFGDHQDDHLHAAAILGHDGLVRAQSTHFPQFTAEEFSAIMKEFEEPGLLAPTGFFLGGTKYMVLQGEPGVVIRGKKRAGGITIKKTRESCVFGIYRDPVTGDKCNMAVESLGDDLIEQGL